jgi:hypothetical protein
MNFFFFFLKKEEDYRYSFEVIISRLPLFFKYFIFYYKALHMTSHFMGWEA